MEKAYRVVAANGQLGLPISWTLPIVQERDRCFVLGADLQHSFPAAELPHLEQDGLLTMLEPADFSVPKEDENDILLGTYDKELFSSDTYVLYWSGSQFPVSHVLLPGPPDTIAVPTRPMGQNAGPLRVFIVGRTSLLTQLKRQAHLFEKQIADQLAAHDWEASAFVDDDTATFLADCLHDIAYDKSTAQRAIAVCAALMRLGTESDVLEEWLPIACDRWGLDAAMEDWNSRIRGTVEGWKVQSRYRGSHTRQSGKTTSKSSSWSLDKPYPNILGEHGKDNRIDRGNGQTQER